MPTHHHHDTKGVDFGVRAVRYDSGWTGAFTRYCHRTFLLSVDIANGATVLDVGCGTGALLRQIVDRFHAVGIGVEPSEQMAAVARSKHPELSILPGVATELPVPDASIDAVVACLAYHHFEDRPAFLQQVTRVLKDTGSLYLVELNLPKPLNALVNAVVAHHGYVERVFYATQLCTELKHAGWVPTLLHGGLIQVVKATVQPH